MMSLNGPQLGTLEAKKLIKLPWRIYGERKQYKKRLVLNKKSKRHTQVTLCIEPEFMENVEEYLAAITPENTSFQILMKQVMLRTVIEITK